MKLKISIALNVALTVILVTLAIDNISLRIDRSIAAHYAPKPPPFWAKGGFGLEEKSVPPPLHLRLLPADNLELSLTGQRPRTPEEMQK